MAENKRQKHAVLRSQLENERSSFLPLWRDLNDYILPRRARFTVSDVNRGDRRNQKIIDGTATMAARTLRSGMMSGITSPARPWFRLSTPDPSLADFGPVKEWLDKVGQLMSTTFLRSNLYNVLPITYGDMGVFATSALSMEEDFDDVIRFYPFPVGSFKISNNDRLKVDVFSRDFRMTVRQIVQRFGQKNQATGSAMWDNFSPQVKNAWDRGEYETWIDVCHIVNPNEDYDQSKSHSKFKKYSSCYYEAGSSTAGTGLSSDNDGGLYLRESGHDYFPILAPRWEVTGEDSYGTDCPGMVSIGDTKALQLLQRRKSQAVEKKINPAMVGPQSLKNSKASILPGDITYSDEREGQKGFRPAHEVNLSLSEVIEDIREHQGRIDKAFFADLFLMLSQSDRRQITAREVDERHEEKLLALGPVLEQLNQDLLDPLIDNTFDIMVKQNKIPPPPEELQGVQLKVEYISIMAQAQKLVGLAGIERFAGFVGQLQATHPEAGDKVDTDHMIDAYGDAVGISAKIIRSDDEVSGIRQGRQKAQQQQAQVDQIQQSAGAARNLSATDMSGDNALTRILKQAQAGQLAPTQ